MPDKSTQMRFKRQVVAWVDRSALLMLLAMLVLFASSISHWYYVPVQPSNTEQWFNSPMNIAELIGRIAMMLIALAIPYFGLQKASVSHLFQRLCWTLLLLVFFFPFYISQWEPESFLTGNTVYAGLERINADMEINMNHQQSDWRYWQKISSPNLLSYRGIQVPAEDGWSVSLINFPEHLYVFQGILNYSNDFLNVVSRGWIFAGVGLIILLIACSLKQRQQPTSKLSRWVFGIILLSIIALIFMPRAMSEYFLQSAKFNAAQGKTGDAITLYRNALHWKPSLAFSLDYYSETLGVLVEKRGCKECYEVLVMQFTRHIKTRNFSQARFILEKIEQRYPQQKATNFWFDSLNNQQAIEEFNRGQYSLAGDYWNMSKKRNPYNPLPHYGIAMVNVKLHHFDAARDSLRTLTELQQYLTFKRLTIKGQYIVMQGWAAYWNNNEHQAFELYSLGLTPEVW